MLLPWSGSRSFLGYIEVLFELLLVRERLKVLVVVHVGQVIHPTASAPPVLCPKDEELQAILGENGDGMSLSGERATELLDGVVVELAEDVEGRDVLVVVEGSRGFLAKGKHPSKHRDG